MHDLLAAEPFPGSSPFLNDFAGRLKQVKRMVQRIKLTQNKSTMVSDTDYDRLMQFNWFHSTNGYAKRTERINGKRRFIYMHREIMNARRGQLVDHIDGDRLNNTRDNLRFVTRSENMWNRKAQDNTVSMFKGVTLHPRGWEARIGYYGERIHLGYFESARFAALAYDHAAQILFGEFRRENLPGHAVPPDIQEQVEAALDSRNLP